MSHHVSAVITCWNELEYTRLYVESPLKHTWYPHEIVLVDSGSVDGTREYLDDLAAAHDHVIVIHNERNLGFPHACNQGIEASSGAYVCLLNNDVEFAPGWLERLVRGMERNHAHAAGPRILWLKMDGRFGHRRIPYIEGWCLLIKRELIDLIGGLDERYSPEYWEDSDFCYHAFVHGFDLHEEPGLGLVHHGSKTAFNQTEFNVREVSNRNGRQFYEKWASHPHRRILVVRLDALGDVVMATAVLGGLRRTYPNARIAAWTLPIFADIVADNPYVDDVVLGTDRAAIDRARRLRPDVVINLQDHDRGRDLARQVGGDETLGLDEPLMHQSVEARRKRWESGLHLVEVMARMAGVEPGRCHVPVRDKGRQHIRNILTQAGVGDDEPLVGVHTFGSSWTGNNWPRPKAERLVRRLAKECRVVLVGRGRFPDVPGVVNALDRTTVRQLASLLERCDLLISTDSGPAHVAGAVGTPTVVTYGPCPPEVTAPFGGESVAIRPKVSCAPCFRTDCRMGRCACAEEIDPDEVFERATPFLERATARPAMR